MSDYEGDNIVKDGRQSPILKTHSSLYPWVIQLCIQYSVLAYEHTQVCILKEWVLVVVRILENTLSLLGSVVLTPVLYRIPFNTNSSVMNLYSEV